MRSPARLSGELGFYPLHNCVLKCNILSSSFNISEKTKGGYKDNKDDNWVQKGTGWERARAARLKRFSARGNRDKDYRFRLFDIPLFRTFLETRNWADISENEYTIISNVEFPPEYFGSEEREFLSREKEKLLRGYRAALDERENNQLQKSPKDKAK